LGSLGTAATNRPIVPAPGDYDVGEIGRIIGRGNRSSRRKPTPATNRLRYDTVINLYVLKSVFIRLLSNHTDLFKGPYKNFSFLMPLVF
jgi:hypothetical protein